MGYVLQVHDVSELRTTSHAGHTMPCRILQPPPPPSHTECGDCFAQTHVSTYTHTKNSPVSVLAGWEFEHAVSEAFMADAALAPASYPFQKDKAIVAASVIDCVGACLYFLITLGLIVLAKRRAEDADTHTVTIHDYSVYVRQLPQDATSNELVDFFSQWGEVRTRQLCRT